MIHCLIGFATTQYHTIITTLSKRMRTFHATILFRVGSLFTLTKVNIDAKIAGVITKICLNSFLKMKGYYKNQIIAIYMISSILYVVKQRILSFGYISLWKYSQIEN